MLLVKNQNITINATITCIVVVNSLKGLSGVVINALYILVQPWVMKNLSLYDDGLSPLALFLY